MIALRSILFNVTFFAWTAIFLIACLPMLALPPRMVYVAGKVWIRVNIFLLRWLVGLTHEFRGTPPRPGERVILAVKHQSAFDTMVFNLAIEQPVFVLKRELFWIPLFGWYLWHCGMIAIDRASGSKAIRSMIRQSHGAIARGQTLLIFPEGTRTVPGAPANYQPGVAALYSQLDLPVIPVALNTGVFWGRRSFLKHPGRMVIEFLDPILPGLPRDQFMAELHKRLEQASDRLVGEASGVVGDSVDNSLGNAS